MTFDDIPAGSAVFVDANPLFISRRTHAAHSVRRHGLHDSMCFLTYVSEEGKWSEGLKFAAGGAAVMGGPMSPGSLVDYFAAARPYSCEVFTQIDSSVGRLS